MRQPGDRKDSLFRGGDQFGTDRELTLSCGLELRRGDWSKRSDGNDFCRDPNREKAWGGVLLYFKNKNDEQATCLFQDIPVPARTLEN